MPEDQGAVAQEALLPAEGQDAVVLAGLAESDDRMIIVSALAAMINGASQIRTMKFRGGNYGPRAEAECDKRVSELERAANRLREALARQTPVSPAEQVGWRPIETLPHPHDAGLFWAAIRTGGINTPLQWEVHDLLLDDETFEIVPDRYQGWNIADYELWQPAIIPTLPTPPAEGSGR